MFSLHLRNTNIVDGAEEFEEHVAHYYNFIGDKRIIGKFRAIGKEIKFVIYSANHRMSSAATYPFNLFGHGWEKTALPSKHCQSNRWWDWPAQKIFENLEILCGGDQERLCVL